MRDAVRSCERGLGPNKVCPSFDLRTFKKFPEEIDPVPGGPLRPIDTVILFSLFACREMEAALRLRSQVVIEEGPGCGTVALHLPVTKTDPKGDGVLRRQGCMCSSSARLCPTAAAWRILQAGETAGATKPEDPFLITADHEPPTKASMIATFRKVALHVGWSTEEAASLTGHALRPTGAQFLARSGVEIQLFCRWESSAVLKYLRDIPLENSETWLAEAVTEAQSRSVETNDTFSLEEIVFHVSEVLSRQSFQVPLDEIVSLLAETLEARMTIALNELHDVKEEAKFLLEDFRQKEFQVKEQWAAELSRSFLPKFVWNGSSNKVHFVKDAYTAACGFEFRTSKDFLLTNVCKEEYAKCETLACQKHLKSWA